MLNNHLKNAKGALRVQLVVHNKVIKLEMEKDTRKSWIVSPLKSMEVVLESVEEGSIGLLYSLFMILKISVAYFFPTYTIRDI